MPPVPAEAVAHPHSGIGGTSPLWCSHGLENAPQIPSALRFCRESRVSWETSLPGNVFALHPWKLLNPFFPDTPNPLGFQDVAGNLEPSSHFTDEETKELARGHSGSSHFRGT